MLASEASFLTFITKHFSLKGQRIPMQASLSLLILVQTLSGGKKERSLLLPVGLVFDHSYSLSKTSVSSLNKSLSEEASSSLLRQR